ncbi:MAG: hypothetical protein HQ501_02425 [Rhodospirillales bacterium]|nr:hypothetical protein [Rhodospirillales bacterium]
MSNILSKLLDQAFPQKKAIPSGEVAPAQDSPAAVMQGFKSMLVPVVGAYRRRFQNYGAAPQGVFWSNPDTVKKRFEILCRVFDPEDIARGESSITDLGCGYGALYDFLNDHPVIRGGEYRGYDICEPLLDACKVRIKDPRASFHLNMQATRPADYSIVSGTFNLKLHATDADWLNYVQISLLSLWQQTDNALAFNMLDDTDTEPQEGLYFANLQAFEAFCRNNLSENVTVITDYGLSDFTILVRR